MVTFISELSSPVAHWPVNKSTHSGSFCSRFDTCGTDFQEDRCAASNKYETQQQQGRRAEEEDTTDFWGSSPATPAFTYNGDEFIPQL